MALNEGFSQVKLDDKGTYGAYNAGTSQAVAFPSQQSFNSFFGEGSSFDPNAPNANFDASGLLGANAGQVKAVSLNSLTPAQSLTVPQATPTANPLDGAVAGATQTSKSLEAYQKELTPPETATSKQYSALTDQLSTLLPGLGGRGEAQLSAEADAGLPALKKQLSELNAQLLAKSAEANLVSSRYDQLSTSLENQSIPTNLVMGQQAQVRKMQLAESNARSSELNLLQARALGLQGNVQAAQDYINRAIDLRYQDRESEVDLKMKQLQLLEGKLNKEEQITKTALERKYADEKEKIAEEKQKSKENMELALKVGTSAKFINKNGEFFQASNGLPFSSPEEFFKAAGVKSFEEAYSKGLVSDVNGATLSDMEFATNARAKYWDAGILPTDNAEVVDKKIQASRIYQDSVRAPAKSSGSSGGGKTKVISATTQNKYALPSDTSQEDYDMVRNTILEQRNSGKPYYDTWGEIADWLQANNMNPATWDSLLWDLLSPEGLAGRNKTESNTKRKV